MCLTNEHLPNQVEAFINFKVIKVYILFNDKIILKLFCICSTSSLITCIVVKCTTHHVKTVKAKQLHYHIKHCVYYLYYVTSQEWLALFNALQTDLSDSKETIEKLNHNLLDMEAQLTTSNSQTQDEMRMLQVRQLYVHQWLTQCLCSQEQHKVVVSELKSELSETTSQLMMKDNELTKLKEDNKLLMKKIRERKYKKRTETIRRVCYCYCDVVYTC